MANNVFLYYKVFLSIKINAITVKAVLVKRDRTAIKVSESIGGCRVHIVTVVFNVLKVLKR